MLHALDAECPDLFLILYWGHYSPWWLLHADTQFDSGLGSRRPRLAFSRRYTRATASRRRSTRPSGDRNQDLPPLGKDYSACGSPIGRGTATWAKSDGRAGLSWTFAAAACWPNHGPIQLADAAERRAIGRFHRPAESTAGVFRHAAVYLGNPWKKEPYGYCCTDGKEPLSP